MKLSTRTTTFVAAIALAIPSAAIAQENMADEANAVAETAEQLEQDANGLSTAAVNETGRDDAARADDDREDRGDDDSGKWGLLGLLGLAGLLGLRRRDDDHRHDRDDVRTTTTADRTGTTTDRRL